MSFFCWLDDAIKHSNEILPYLDAKYQRGKSLPNYIEEGRLVEPYTKAILVDGENSGEMFTIKERGYLGSTFKVLQSVSQVSEIWLQYILEAYRPLLKGSKVGAAIPHQGNRIKNFEKTQVANFQMIAFWRLYSKIKNVLKTMVDNQVLTF